MPDLTSKKCVPCEGGVQPLSREEAEEMMEQADGWKLADDAKSIHRTFKFADFVQAMEFVKQVADLAEAEGHHPDITINYNKVTLVLTTHAIGGLSENDFILAAKVNAL